MNEWNTFSFSFRKTIQHKYYARIYVVILWILIERIRVGQNIAGIERVVNNHSINLENLNWT